VPLFNATSVVSTQPTPSPITAVNNTTTVSINKGGKGNESQLAHQLLDGLSGIEIGASLLNPFGLDTLNVDYSANETDFFL
jgi:hypothetical protein